MDINEIHPDFRKAIQSTPSLPYDSPFWQPLIRLVFPLAARTPVVDGVSTADLRLGHIRLRIYIPQERRSGAGMMWIHGGGMIVGTEKQDNRTCSTFARELGLVVVSVGYRLAPKHPFPAAHDDCLEAWRWFLANAAEYGVDPQRIIVAAESGGGSHAASLVHRIHDDGGTQPAAQVLLVPMLDDRTATDPSLDEGHFIWRWQDTRSGWSAWLGHEPGQDTEPAYAVPARRDDLTGLPPTWIGCGDKDLFYMEDRRYAERLEAAGVDVTFLTMPGGPHGFHVVAHDAPASLDFMAKCRRWIAQTVGIAVDR